VITDKELYCCSCGIAVSFTTRLVMFVDSVSMFRDKPSVGTDVFNDDMVTDDSEAAAKQHDDTIGELGLILLQNNVCFSLCSVNDFIHALWLILGLQFNYVDVKISVIND